MLQTCRLTGRHSAFSAFSAVKSASMEEPSNAGENLLRPSFQPVECVTKLGTVDPVTDVIVVRINGVPGFPELRASFDGKREWNCRILFAVTPKDAWGLGGYGAWELGG